VSTGDGVVLLHNNLRCPQASLAGPAWCGITIKKGGIMCLFSQLYLAIPFTNNTGHSISLFLDAPTPGGPTIFSFQKMETNQL
jgi:hypothetical protein